MNNQAQIITQIGSQGILPLYYIEDTETCFQLTDALYRSGIRVIEFTNRGAAAMENFKALIHARDHHWPGLILGIGTIKSSRQAIDFDQAGADFLISPAFLPELAATARQLGKLWVPGCMTPSEIAAAEQAGTKFVKLFPGNLLGPTFVTAIRELFPDLLFMPTGGVTPEPANLQQWFKAGVYAVGMGSQLITKDKLAARDFKGLANETANLLALVEAIRKS